MTLFIVLLHLLIDLNNVTGIPGTLKSSCGIDKSPVDMVYPGLASIETYPWLGILYYPFKNTRFTTAVVLVTRQIVLGTATEIDQMPKLHFRKFARVVLGQNCSGSHISIRDYSYHPDYSKRSHSALAIIQLEVDSIKIELRPICHPPAHFTDSKFYAMTMSDDCKNSVINIYKMQYINKDECKTFYRRSGLGFGVYGPGCESPARFLDYGMYHQWVRTSIDRIGRPAISRIGSNEIVLRRTLSKVQRFGPCDPEEKQTEIYTDQTRILRSEPIMTKVKYNISLYANVEYTCVVFKAEYANINSITQPKISLRRWCSGPVKMCHGFQFLEIHFYIEIAFYFDVTYSVMAYGKTAKVIDVTRALNYINDQKQELTIYTYNETKTILEDPTFKENRNSFWFFKEDF